MAIVIPSKNIYSIGFDPVIDNQIDKVEANIKAVEIINDIKNVHNEQIIDIPLNDNTIKNYNSIAYHQTIIGGDDETSFFANYIEVTPRYAHSKIYIPVYENNSKILSILTGLNTNGDANIQLTISGINRSGKVAGYAIIGQQPNFSNVSGSAGLSKGTFSIAQTVITEKTIDKESEGAYTLFHTDKTYENDLGNNTPNEIKTTLKFITRDNILHVDAIPAKKDNKDYYLIDLTVLIGIEVILMAFSKRIRQEGIATPVNIPTLSNYGVNSFEEYIPDTITISLNGKIIQLNLQDKTATISNGNKVFSFDGNELIQSTNTPTQESKYQNIIDEWKNGKQTATITCPIADFYDENANKVIDTSTSTKMLFDIGDIVIPYTYTNQGDKPIAYNKDFTPKRFKIVGTNISKKQGGTQELTLQEV